MGIESKSGKPVRHRINPAEALMDDLGLPREAKYDFLEAYINTAPPEEVVKTFEDIKDQLSKRTIKKPEVNWDTVQDTIHIQFKAGTDYSKRVLMDERRFVDYDETGNLTEVILRDVSQGVTVQGLPEAKRISRMLRRREISVVNPKVPS